MKDNNMEKMNVLSVFIELTFALSRYVLDDYINTMSS